MASSNFLAWDAPQVNIESDAAYAADSIRTNGAPVGAILPSATFNKFALQTSTFVASFGEFLANNGFSTSDANQAALAAVLDNILLSSDQKSPLTLVPYSPSVALNAALADGFYLPLNGNTSIAISGQSAGQLVAIYYVQDATGGRTVTFPSALFEATQPDPTPNTTSVQLFRCILGGPFLVAVSPLMSQSGLFEVGSISAGGNVSAGGSVSGATLSIAGIAAAASLQVAGTQTQGKVLIANAAGVFVPRLFTLNNVTGSRAQGVVYTNNSGAEMKLSGFMQVSGGSGDSTVTVTVTPAGGASMTLWSTTITGTITGEAGAFKADIPTGAQYEVTGTGRFTGTIGSWIEGTYV
jgi:hypothetical protein